MNITGADIGGSPVWALVGDSERADLELPDIGEPRMWEVVWTEHGFAMAMHPSGELLIAPGGVAPWLSVFDPRLPRELEKERK